MNRDFYWLIGVLVGVSVVCMIIIGTGGEAPVRAPEAIGIGVPPEAAGPAAGAQAFGGTGFPPGDAPDFRLGWEYSLKKVFKEEERFSGRRTGPVEIMLAQNEYEAAQLVFFNVNKDMENVRISVGDLTRLEGGEILGRENVTIRIVGYVKTERPDYPVPYIGWWPDPLPEGDTVNLTKGMIQPVWLTVYAPDGTPPGIYRGAISVEAPGTEKQTVALLVRVWGFALPKTPRLASAFDLYANRLNSGYSNYQLDGFLKWRDRMDELKDLYIVDMLEHRIAPVLNIDPLSLDADRKLALYEEHGLSAFAIGGSYGGSFNNRWPQGEAELYELMRTFRRYAAALKEEGRIDQAYIYTYDEPKFGDPRVAQVSEAIHWADPELTNLVCMYQLPDVRQNPGWLKDIDIFCIRNVTLDEDVLASLRQYDKEVWMYVSGPKPPFPTYAIDYFSIAYRVLPWMAWKYNVKGILYWCVNFWTKNPWEDPMNTEWGQNGNGILYYPGLDGPIPSVRLEVIRDSMEDYDYLSLLRERIDTIRENAALAVQYKAVLDEKEKLLDIGRDLVKNFESYTRDEARLLLRRKQIAEAIEQLNQLTGN